MEIGLSGRCWARLREQRGQRTHHWRRRGEGGFNQVQMAGGRDTEWTKSGEAEDRGLKGVSGESFSAEITSKVRPQMSLWRRRQGKA